jgi:hypothetical protein
MSNYTSVKDFGKSFLELLLEQSAIVLWNFGC